MTRHKNHVIYTMVFLGTTVVLASASFINWGYYLSQKKYNFNYLTDLETYQKKDAFHSGELTSQDDVDELSLTLTRDDLLYETEHDMQYLLNSSSFANLNNEWSAHFDNFDMRIRNNHAEFQFNLRVNYSKDKDPLNGKVDAAVLFFPWIYFEYLPDCIPQTENAELDHENYINALGSGVHKGIIGYKVADMRMNMRFTYVNVWDTRVYVDFLFMYNNYVNNYMESDNKTQWWPSHWYFTSYFFQNKTMTIPPL